MSASALQSSRRLRPLLNVGPVPAGSTTHGPARFGQQIAMTPHFDRVPLDAKAPGDVVGTHGVALHGATLTCNVRVDKCNARRYSRDMTKTQTNSQGAMNGHEARVHVDMMKAALKEADYPAFYALVEQVSVDHFQAAVVIAYILGHDDGARETVEQLDVVVEVAAPRTVDVGRIRTRPEHTP